MADGSMMVVNPKVAEIVSGVLAKRTGAAPTAGDVRITALTSLDMVNLMLAIEAEFDIEIPAALMRPENFRSLQAIDALVAQVTAG